MKPNECCDRCEDGKHADEEIRNIIQSLVFLECMDDYVDDKMHEEAVRLQQCLECRG